MSKRTLSLSEVYRVLEPGPVVLLSTQKKGKPNVMAMSWHTMMEFEPPLVGCIVSNRNYSFDALKSTKECVINIPTARIASAVVSCGNTCGRRLSKFNKFGLTPVPASLVSAPLVDECYVNLECRVVDSKLVEKYNFFVLEVVKAWIDHKKKGRTLHHRGKGQFMLDGKTIRLSSKMK